MCTIMLNDNGALARVVLEFLEEEAKRDEYNFRATH